MPYPILAVLLAVASVFATAPTTDAQVRPYRVPSAAFERSTPATSFSRQRQRLDAIKLQQRRQAMPSGGASRAGERASLQRDLSRSRLQRQRLHQSGREQDPGWLILEQNLDALERRTRDPRLARERREGEALRPREKAVSRGSAAISVPMGQRTRVITPAIPPRIPEVDLDLGRFGNR